MSESTVVSPPQAASSADRPARPPIVIVGGGFAGIATAKALRRCDAEVTLIDRRNHHIFQPLLYQVATSVLASADVATPIRQLAASQENVSVLLAEVVGVITMARTHRSLSARRSIWCAAAERRRSHAHPSPRPLDLP
jgi:NADH:ubiquinone reductase (H+-translocating)